MMEKYYNKNSNNKIDVAETPLANKSDYSQNLESDFPKDNFPNGNSPQVFWDLIVPKEVQEKIIQWKY